MFKNGDITIYNPQITNHDVVFYRCQIKGVWVIYRNTNQLSTNIAVETVKMLARIPLNAAFEKEYISPQAYAAADHNKYFTLAPGSIMVRGLVEMDKITKADLMKIFDLVTITSVSDNRYGSARNRHWKVEGV